MHYDENGLAVIEGVRELRFPLSYLLLQLEGAVLGKTLFSLEMICPYAIARNVWIENDDIMVEQAVIIIKPDVFV